VRYIRVIARALSRVTSALTERYGLYTNNYGAGTREHSSRSSAIQKGMQASVFSMRALAKQERKRQHSLSIHIFFCLVKAAQYTRAQLVGEKKYVSFLVLRVCAPGIMPLGGYLC
jgi:hypothetical protein